MARPIDEEKVAMYPCPRCHQTLTRNVGPHGISWQCGECDGRAMSFGVLRKSIDPTCVAEIAGTAVTAPNRNGCTCPMCSLPMTEMTVKIESHDLTLDVCQACAFVWFDAREYELFPPAPPPTHVLGEIDMTKLSLETREKLAMAEVREIAERARDQDPIPDESWKAAPAMFGMPVELDAPPMTRFPWATYSLSLIITAVSLAAFTHLNWIIDRYGLVPDDVWRDHGATLLTSFFLHVGLVHLFGNLYFLMVFGRSVENDLGPKRWLLLILLATLTGDFLHVLGNLHSSTPCIGASGGISGILAYYALRFPKMRLSMFFYMRWIQFPAWTAFVIWVALQILGAFEQHYGISNVASLAHLGGCIPGILFYLIWSKRNVFPDADPTKNIIQVKVK